MMSPEFLKIIHQAFEYQCYKKVILIVLFLSQIIQSHCKVFLYFYKDYKGKLYPPPVYLF